MTLEPVAGGSTSLVDAIDHLLDRGAVLFGDATLSVAGIDLVYVGVNLLVSSVETLRQRGDWLDGAPALPPAPGPHPAVGPAVSPPPNEAASPFSSGPYTGNPRPVTIAGEDFDPRGTALDLESTMNGEGGGERSLVRLVLTLVELLRQLLERQALRRVEGDGLTDQQVERLGRALMELSEKMTELRALFGLEERDLAIDLGPLGRLV